MRDVQATDFLYTKNRQLPEKMQVCYNIKNTTNGNCYKFIEDEVRMMSYSMKELLDKYIAEIKKIYGTHLQEVILYGSYARGDFKEDSDIDIMILLDITDMEMKQYQHQLSYATFDFNMDNDLDIKPITKNDEHFRKWSEAYPFYENVRKEGVRLYENIQEKIHAIAL